MQSTLLKQLIFQKVIYKIKKKSLNQFENMNIMFYKYEKRWSSTETGYWLENTSFLIDLIDWKICTPSTDNYIVKQPTLDEKISILQSIQIWMFFSLCIITK